MTDTTKQGETELYVPGPLSLKLSEPFPEKLVETRGPREDRYVSWIHWAQRALLEFGPYAWVVQEIYPPQVSGRVWRVPEEDDPWEAHWADKWSPWVVLGAISAEIDGVRASYSGVGEGKEPKGAESDAFKRALSKSGMGQHLWAEPAYWLPAAYEKRLKEQADG